MSHRLSPAEEHGAHEDSRSEHARALRAVAHEAELHRLVDDHWRRRASALMPSAEPVLVEDFGTQCTL